MRKLWDFHGGIHPPENKRQSTSRPIRIAGIPKQLVIPLQQHIGAAARAVVEVGQQVKKGELIADAVGAVSVPVHASTSGTIVATEDRPVAHPSGLSDRCIVLEADGEDLWTELQPCPDYKQLSTAGLLAKVRNAGIAGMGGAGFPTEIKLHPPKNDKVNALILNGAECEPYITADDMLMRERADWIVKGLEIMAYLLEPEEVFIGIEDNKPEAIEALRQATQQTKIHLVVVPTKYPSGGEKQLIKILTGLEVPHGRIPADIGVMCQNVGTAAAVYRAVRHGEPLISRITTVTGQSVRSPGNFETRIGTPIEFLLQEAGYQAESAGRLILGGPMMGFSLSHENLPITKTTNCILAATAEEFPDPLPEQNCIRCGMCEAVCPAELLPQQLYWFARSEELEKAESYNLFDCIECGACAYVCPSSIPLVQYYRFAKNAIRLSQAEHQKSDKARERFEFRKLRLEREQEEKAAKRKARAEAAAKAQAERKQREASSDTAANTGRESDAASKQAAVAAAVERAKAKRQNPAKQNPKESGQENKPLEQQLQLPSTEELKANIEKAKAKLEKVRAALTDAENKGSPTVDKMRAAVTKNEERLAAAELALRKASDAAKHTNAPSASENAPSAAERQPQVEKVETAASALDSEALQANLQKAEDKLAMMQGMLTDAIQENDPKKVAKLERAVEKNRERVASARKALNAVTDPVAQQ